MALLAGAVGSAAADQSGARQRTQPVEIEVALFASVESLPSYLECAREYERLRPNVRVNLYGDPRIADKIQVRILEGTYPEIINSVQNVTGLIDKGLMVPLDEFLDGPNWEGDTSWRESFLPGSLDRYTRGNQTYGIPLGYYTHSIWYNKQMFEEHGWSPPTTWEEFLELCEQIRRAGIWPMAFQGRYPLYAQRMIDSVYFHLAGRDRFDALKALHPGAHNNAELIQSLSLVQTLATEYFQPGCMGMSHTEAELQFFLGRTAMVSCGSWLWASMEGKIPDDFRIGTFNYPLPGRGDPGALYASGGYIWVFKSSRYPEVAVDFLRFLTSRQVAARFCEKGLPVAIKGVNQKHLPEGLEDLARMLESATTSYGDAAGEQFPQMLQNWNDLFPRLLAGDLMPEAAAQQLEQSAALLRNRAENPHDIVVRHIWKPAILLGVMGISGIFIAAGTIRTITSTLRKKPRSALGDLRPLRGRYIVAFIGPAFILYTVFVIGPSIISFGWSVYEWDGLTDRVYVGARNFARLLLESDSFWTALGNNLFLMFVIPAFILPLSLFFAACLSRRVHGAALFRITFFFPNILGGVAVALLWMHLYNPQGGLLNSMLVAVGQLFSSIGLSSVGAWFAGFESFPWLEPQRLYWSLVPIMVWGGCGFNIVLFLAAMESIPMDLYEAAEIDGASPLRQFATITLPLIWEVISIAVVFLVIGGMKAFEIIWLLTNQMPTTQSHVIGTKMVQAMFAESSMGEATAIAVLLFVMVLLGTVGTLRLMRRDAVEF